MATHERLIVIIVAMIANLTLAVIKFGAFLLTASASMLAETYHSLSDTGNQVLLLIGLYYARKQADPQHPFGYGKASFFYAFLVAVLLFGIAGWESLRHGIDAVRAQEPIQTGTVDVGAITVPAVYIAYVVLIATIVLDAISYWRAKQALDVEIANRGWQGLREAVAKSSDAPVLAVLIENAIATAGATIALIAIAVSQITGDPIYDAVGAVLIGVLLMSFALLLGAENKRLLLGEALPVEDQRPLEELVETHEGVVELTELRTVYFGPENVVVTADIAFQPGLDTEEIDRLIGEIERSLKTHQPLIETVYIEPELSGDNQED